MCVRVGMCVCVPGGTCVGRRVVVSVLCVGPKLFSTPSVLPLTGLVGEGGTDPSGQLRLPCVQVLRAARVVLQVSLLLQCHLGRLKGEWMVDPCFVVLPTCRPHPLIESRTSDHEDLGYSGV